MQIIQSKAKIKNGKIILESPPQELLNNQEIEVVIILKEPNKQEEFKEARQEMQTAFKEAGIETPEQILALIREVKLELIEDRN
jgi:Trm5-related predicted tRNA methylase